MRLLLASAVLFTIALSGWTPLVLPAAAAVDHSLQVLILCVCAGAVWAATQ
ncbi:hypothetical protein [Posidoniimonas polymericola]|nr:hypothetical protein [Posidoniimonas polymericola]